MSDRRFQARDVRAQAAEAEFARPVPQQAANGEEADYPFVANYSKGLPHDDRFGEVQPEAYKLLLRAVSTGREEDFEKIPLGGDRKLVNPQSALGFDLEGPDAQALAIPPAPRIDSARNSAEMVELYWMALLRDVSFTTFEDSDLAGEAARELNGLSDYRAPRGKDGAVTPALLFRGDTRGDVVGPYVSQFLLKDIDYGTLRIPQRQAAPDSTKDFVTDLDTWKKVQNGVDTAAEQRNFDDLRYIRNPRELAHYVHYDALYEAYLNACLILLGTGAPFDSGNPYLHSRNQEGFGTYGGPHVLSLVTEVATRALKGVWHKKWYVHRRLRPEEFGGRIHLHLSGQRDYPVIDSEVFDNGAVALKRTFERFGSYLLPQAFREGSPTHPAYGAGHATVAGACVTVLKAWFDESSRVDKPVVPSEDGLSLVPYGGADAGALTVGGELNKLAANVSIGRNMGGVHWRSDYSESVRLGEEIAIGVLREVVESLHEHACFTLSKFDGTTITIG